MPALGPSGTAIILEREAQSIMRWQYSTDVIKSRNGKEYRSKLHAVPREFHEFTAELTDAQARVLRGQINIANALAQPFLLAVRDEELAVSSQSSANGVFVKTTTLSDWCVIDQRIVILSSSGYALSTFITIVSATSINFNDSIVGSHNELFVIPAIAVYLDNAQVFGKYAVNAQRFDFKAESLRVTPFLGTGATVATYDGLPVYTLPLLANEVVSEMALAETDRVDFGGNLSIYSPRTFGDWQRSMTASLVTAAQRQYMKAFFKTVAGRHKAFLLPTWANEFAVTARTANTITFSGPPTAGHFNYATQWFPSPAHRRVQVTHAGGAIAYYTISGASDNGNGTQTITVAPTVAGTIVSMCFLETCRLDTDELVMMATPGRTFVELQAKVVQQ